MNNWSNPRRAILIALALALLGLSGCNSVGSAAADLGLAGAGGALGYEVSDRKIGGAAAGAALGYVGSRIAQSEVRRSLSEAEQRGYDRAMKCAFERRYTRFGRDFGPIRESGRRPRDPGCSGRKQSIPSVGRKAESHRSTIHPHLITLMIESSSSSWALFTRSQAEKPS